MANAGAPFVSGDVIMYVHLVFPVKPLIVEIVLALATPTSVIIFVYTSQYSLPAVFLSPETNES